MTSGNHDTDAPAEPVESGILGERGAASLDKLSAGTPRMGAVTAVVLMSALGLGMLTWYYAGATAHEGRPRRSSAADGSRASPGDVGLPSLGHIDPPAPWHLETSAPELPLQPPPGASLYGQPGAGWSPPPVKTPAQIEEERLLSGAVFARNGTEQVPMRAPGAAAPVTTAYGGVPDDSGSGGQTEIDHYLRAPVVSAVRAQYLPTRRLLLPRGAFIDCTLETAIDSSLPGMTTCIVATDTFGADGAVVLLERGTKLVGETRGQVQQGSARIFVLWTEARTPEGVVISLASPGTDELGRSGLGGKVNRHFFQRFGAAILISAIEGAVQAATRPSAGSGAVVYNPSTTQDVMTEVLKGTINIPPSVVKQQGDRIQVLVARDLDFRSVYELQPHDPGH